MAGEDGGAVPGRIFAIGNKKTQRDRALELGLPEECYCDSETQDVQNWLEERTEGLGVSVFYECVGKNDTLSLAKKSFIKQDILFSGGSRRYH